MGEEPRSPPAEVPPPITVVEPPPIVAPVAEVAEQGLDPVAKKIRNLNKKVCALKSISVSSWYQLTAHFSTSRFSSRPSRNSRNACRRVTSSRPLSLRRSMVKPTSGRSSRRSVPSFFCCTSVGLPSLVHILRSRHLPPIYFASLVHSMNTQHVRLGQTI